MMARGHAVMGATVWLVGCAAAQALGVQLSPAIPTIGTVVCSGWTLAPDLDHPESTVSQSLGPASRLIAKALARLGAVVHEHTRTIWDRPDHDGHRTLTHTVAWAALCAAFTVGAGRHYGPWVAALLVAGAAWLAAKAIFPLRYRRTRVWGLPVRVDWIAAALLGVEAYRLTPGDGWWLGLAVGVGCVAHCLGDAMTESGCPFLWPIPIGHRGRRRTWYLIGLPRFLRFHVDSAAERAVTCCFVLVSSYAVYLLVWGH